MINDIINALLLAIPWWLYGGVALLGVLAALFFLHVPSRHVIWIAGLAMVGVFSAALMQRGYKAKEERDWKDAQDAIDRATKARRKQEELNRDPKHLRDDDGFRRPD